MSDKELTDEEREHLAKGGRAKWSQKFDPNVKKVEGYPKWGTPTSSTADYDPENQVQRAKDADKGIAPTISAPTNTPLAEQTTEGQKEKTITDGKTAVTVSNTPKAKYIPGAPGKAAAKNPNDVAVAARQAFFYGHGSYPPCINTDCRSYGIPHDNCLCYGTTSDAGINYGMAKGGVVSERFCSKTQKHHPKCKYFLKGGQVDEMPQGPQPLPQFQDNPLATIDHAAVEHGLLGLLKDIGHKNISDPEKHTKLLQDAKDKYSGNELVKKMPGHKLGEHMQSGNYEKAAETMNGHPLVGAVGFSKLNPILQRLSRPLMAQEPNAMAFRNASDYLGSSMRGENTLNRHSEKFFGNESFPDKIEPDSDSREELKNHLNAIQADPSKALDIGGSLSHYLPQHGTALGARSAIAINYLNSLKPMSSQNGPLDTLYPVNKMDEAPYNRALDIAQQPLLVLHYAKEGYLQGQDVTTINTIYPELHKAISSKLSEQLMDAKQKGIEIPYRQKLGLSMLLGQPLDSSMTAQGMQAIINSAGPVQQQASQEPKQPKKASKVELDQIDKVDKLSELPSESRQIERRD